MEKDYSEYHHSEYDNYCLRRSNTENVRLDYFVNKAMFRAEDKTVRIRVDGCSEYFSMMDSVNDVEKARAEREGRVYTPVEERSVSLAEDVVAAQERYERLKRKYNIELGQPASICACQTGVIENPMINIFSDAAVRLNYGEGILNFIYADFKTPLKEQLENAAVVEALRKYAKEELGTDHSEDQQNRQPGKVYDEDQEVVERFYEYESTFCDLREVAYASLYSAICPPLFKGDDYDLKKKLAWYGNYLLRLQKE